MIHCWPLAADSVSGKDGGYETGLSMVIPPEHACYRLISEAKQG